MAYFKIENGVVIQRQPNAEDGFIEGSDDVICGYTYKSGKFSAPVAQEVTPDWPTLIAFRRFKAEESGTTWNGYGIATDRSSQNKITQEDIAVNRGLRTDGSGWKCLDLSTGVIVFRPTSDVEIQQLSAAVYLHVSSSFKREEELLAAVADGSITAAMVEEGWPV